MIIINGKKWVKNDREAISTLFQRDGTFEGFYKKRKHSVLFYDMQANLFCALVCNGDFNGFVLASNRNGRQFFMHDCNQKERDIFGVPAGYLDSIEYSKQIFNTIKGE